MARAEFKLTQFSIETIMHDWLETFMDDRSTQSAHNRYLTIGQSHRSGLVTQKVMMINDPIPLRPTSGASPSISIMQDKPRVSPRSAEMRRHNPAPPHHRLNSSNVSPSFHHCSPHLEKPPQISSKITLQHPNGFGFPYVWVKHPGGSNKKAYIQKLQKPSETFIY